MYVNFAVIKQLQKLSNCKNNMIKRDTLASIHLPSLPQCLNMFCLQAFNKLLSLAQNAAQQKFTSNSWSHMLLSTSSVSLHSVLIVLDVAIVQINRLASDCILRSSLFTNYI